ncbi:DUF4348 domain-containing protein [Croceitalea marina]|uniref:DUF4348 domain-containing protein n=1 Tax=Croceitalea marina TaxID=1775166 RepID=A0ABW5MTJ5_9FLAO
MKKTGIALLALFILSCQPKPKKTQVQTPGGASNAVSSISSQKGKGNFMDFFIHFMSDSTFQKEQVRFPAQVDQKTITTKEHWSPMSFSKEKVFHSLIQSDTLNYFERDFGINPINVSIICFETLTIENLTFYPKSETWYLDKTFRTHLSENDDYAFFSFINTFSLDSVFQRHHIRFPLPYFHLDYQNEYETLKDTFLLDTWKYINLNKSLRELVTLNQNIESDYRVLLFRGVANGVHLKYTFRYIDKQWKLIQIEDYST